MKILLIEDDEQLCRTLTRALSEEGHLAEYALDGATGESLASDTSFELVILDLTLPDKSGFDVCRTLRRQGLGLPILMLTAQNSTEMKVKGLDSGADDYLCKPFDYDELFARIRSLQRRQSELKTTDIEIFGISLDTVAHEVKSRGAVINLTATEYKILEYFVTNSNRLITREMIAQHLWPADRSPVSNVVDTLIKKLRSKLGWDSRVGPLRTIRGAGYRLTK
jgi:DNA-binding response OmpR family regulator